MLSGSFLKINDIVLLLQGPSRGKSGTSESNIEPGTSRDPEIIPLKEDEQVDTIVTSEIA